MKQKAVETAVESAVLNGAADSHCAYMELLRAVFCRQFRIEPISYDVWIRSMLPGTGIHCTEIPADFNATDLSVQDVLDGGDRFARNRETTGSYYTPGPLARYMAEMGILGALIRRYPEHQRCAERWIYGEKLSSEDRAELLECFLKLRIFDMASGDGVFLGAVVELGKSLLPDRASASEKLKILENIGAADIRPEALEAWAIRTVVHFPELIQTPIALNGFCTDSVHGDTLTKIPWILDGIQSGGFDLIIGNPPYLGEKGNREMFQKLRSTEFGRKYGSGRMDLFYYFFHRSMDLLRKNGQLCQLTTSYYATADSAKALRDRLRTEGAIRRLIIFDDQPAFPEVKSHHLIIHWEKGTTNGHGTGILCRQVRSLKHYHFEDLRLENEGVAYEKHSGIPSESFFDAGGQIALDPGAWHLNISKTMILKAPLKLSDRFRVNQGIVSGMDRRDHSPVFVLEPGEGLDLPTEMLVPWYKNSDIRRYAPAEKSERRLIYLSNESEEIVPELILKHFEPYREFLMRRRECANGKRPWYGLQWPRNSEIFRGPKLVAPQRCAENRFAYTEKPWFASADVYFITEPSDGCSLFALMAYLNSDCLYYWFYQCGKRKGTILELYATPLKGVPIHSEWLQKGGILHGLGEELRDATLQKDVEKVHALRKKVDSFIYEAFGFTDTEIEAIKMLISVDET